MIQASSLVSIGTTAGHDPLEELAALGGHGETRFFWGGASCLMGIMPLGPFFFCFFLWPSETGVYTLGLPGGMEGGGQGPASALGADGRNAPGYCTMHCRDCETGP